MSTADTAPPSGGEILVGREAELHRLSSLLEEAVQGSGGLVFLTGEPGIGKTALAGEFLRRARSNPALTVVRGRCVEHYGPGEAYLPFLEVLQTLLEGNARKGTLDVLLKHSPSWCLQIPAAAPSLEAREALQRQTVGLTRERMLRELADFVTAGTSIFPVILLLEDMHWADPSSVDALRVLAARSARLHLLILATYRASDVERTAHALRACRRDLEGERYVHGLDLGPLRLEDVASYLNLRFVSHAFPPELARLVHERTEGVPLFMSNFVDFLCARGQLGRADPRGPWILRDTSAEGSGDVPETLKAVIRRRAEALPAPDRTALECASVLGRDFLSTVLAAVADQDEADLQERLRRLGREYRLVEERGEEELPDGSSAIRYRFTHSLYQDFFYRDLVPKRRELLHRKTGDTLLRHYGEDAPRIAAALALHFEKGHDFASAVTYAMHAGDNAARLYAYPEAVAHYDHALALAAKGPADRGHTAPLLHQKRGTVELASGRFDEAVADFTVMRTQAQAVGDLALEGAALDDLCNALFFVQRIEEMAVRAHEALGVAVREGGEALRVQALVRVAQILEAEGRLTETIPLLDEIIDAGRRLGYERALLAALTYRGFTHYWMGEYGQAEGLFAEGVATGARLRDGFLFLACRTFYDLCRARQGLLSKALEGLEETAEVARRNGDRFWRPRIVSNLGWVRAQAFAETIAFGEEALRLGREFRLPSAPETEALLDLCLDYARAGRFEDGERMIQELQTVDERARGSWHGWLHDLRMGAVVAEYRWLRGQSDKAYERAVTLLEAAEARDAFMFVAWARRLLGEIALREGRFSEAVAESQAALADLARRPAPLESWRILATLARARRALGEPDLARQAFQESQRVVSEISAGIVDGPLRAAFLAAPLVREVAAGAGEVS